MKVNVNSFILGVVAVGLLFFNRGILAEEDNLIKNPGFEEDADNDGKPDNWSYWTGEGSPIFGLKEGGHSGKLAVTIEGKTNDYGVVVQEFPVKPNTNYTVTFWYKVSQSDYQTMEYEFLGERLEISSRATDWTKVTRIKDSGEKTKGNIEFRFYHRNNTLWIDDVEVQEVEMKEDKYTHDLLKEKEIYFKAKEPLFEELLTDKPLKTEYFPYWGYNCWDVGRGRASAKKFGFRYCQEEQWKELRENNFVHMGRSEECIKNKAKFMLEISEIASMEKYAGKGLWAFNVKDEVYTAAIELGGKYCIFPTDEKMKEEIKQRYGFGKYGPPTSKDDTDPFRLIAYRRWVADQLKEGYKKSYEEIKKNHPEILMVSSTYQASIPADDFSAIAPYFDIFTAQTYHTWHMKEPHPAMIYQTRTGCDTKCLVDLTGKPVSPSPQICDYGSSPTHADIRERFSQIFRNGGQGIFVLAVEWFDRELAHHKYASPERWKAILEILETIRKMNKVKVPNDPDCAIFYSSDSLLTQELPMLNDSMYAVYCLLGPISGSWFSFIDDRQIERGIKNLSDYKMLYVPFAKYERYSVVKKISEYVKEGGILILADPEGFTYDINGEKLDSTREDLMGLKVGEKNLGGIVTTKKGLSFILPEEGKKVTIVNAIPLATFSDGSPAITLNKYGKGKVICFASNPFAQSPELNKNLTCFFLNFMEEAGIKMKRDIWRFKFPPLKTVSLPEPKDYCLTENNIFFQENIPIDKHNLKTDATYTYSHFPTGDKDVKEEGEIPVSEGKVTDRKNAANNKIRDGSYRWVSPQETAPSKWIVSWNDSQPADIIFDLKKSFNLNRLKLFYSGQLPSVTVAVSNDKINWQTISSSSKEDFTEDVLDKAYDLKGGYRYVKISFAERDEGKKIELVEVEIWGEESGSNK